ncbi:MAG: lipid-A-disaccharide synthase N-terminal domain-containing protein [Phycisphaeraceae bacterium]|nr:lipid-A-disaccharide synthase N-terminal domain-containing protein [Phycisphaeraceae bacterium]MBX3406300.1 lipid-A-disaccharide synthase N-terminal domain-containing protein [Phycisphaeraceae bacterium]
MKWEPVAAMAALLLLGVWVVWGPSVRHELRPGAMTTKYNFAGLRGELETVRDPSTGDCSFRLLPRDGPPGEVFGREKFIEMFGAPGYDRVTANAGNLVFRALNITSWGGVVWVCIGFLGQGAFFGRMFIQWLVSEKEKRSVVPEVFWWLSLVGGVTLFAYFAWRQDIVGVLGQTSGVVIYARNIRLIRKRARRDARDRAAAVQTAAAPAAG